MTSYVSVLEQVVGEVSDWALSQAQLVTEALSPDGKPFGMQEVPIDEQLADYMQIVGQPQLWVQWIMGKTQEIVAKLQSQGINPVDIEAIEPMKIASVMAMDYSFRMESLLRRPRG